MVEFIISFDVRENQRIWDQNLAAIDAEVRTARYEVIRYILCYINLEHEHVLFGTNSMK